MTRIDPHPAASSLPAGESTLAAAIELTKPGITRLVAITVGVGFIMGIAEGASTASAAGWGALLSRAALAIAGAALAASGASALNEWMERDRDAAMSRTQARPVPSGQLRPHTALAIGLGLGAAGIALLLFTVNWAAAVIAFAVLALYLGLYTPLKPVSPLSTLVGAVPGALPPLVGWAAAWTTPLHGLDRAGGWSLFLLMFVWQIPHVLAIAWRHREDYARGGHRVLPVVESDGSRTALVSITWAAALIPISLIPVMAMSASLGWIYASAAIALGAWHLLAARRFAVALDDSSAKQLFIASIVYLPVVLAAMVTDTALAAML